MADTERKLPAAPLRVEGAASNLQVVLIPPGWLVYSERGKSTTFVPDPEHAWACIEPQLHRLKIRSIEHSVEGMQAVAAERIKEAEARCAPDSNPSVPSSPSSLFVPSVPTLLTPAGHSGSAELPSAKRTNPPPAPPRIELP